LPTPQTIISPPSITASLVGAASRKAIVALSHKVLVILYHVLREKKPYRDLGADYLDKLDTTRLQRHHIQRLEQLGYTVTLTPKEVA
jgi:hypothetical protein